MDADALNSVINRLLEAREKPGKIVQLSETESKQICFVSRSLFLRQTNLLELEAPVISCGLIVIPVRGLLCDLLWSDPDAEVRGWGTNDRGVSYTFGSDTVSEFLKRLDLDQVVEDGFEFFANKQLVTIFSAPNYCGEFDNAGAMMSVEDNLTCSFQILKPNEKKFKFSFGSRSGSKTSFPYPKLKVS